MCVYFFGFLLLVKIVNCKMQSNEIEPIPIEQKQTPETNKTWQIGKESSSILSGASDEFDDAQSFCRLCYGTRDDDSNLIEPCSCKGTVAKVHRNCLEKWLNRIGSTKCELCLYEFQCEEKRRYGLLESIRIYLRSHRHRQIFVHDLCLFFIMNVITLTMIFMLLQTIYHVSTDAGVFNALPVWYFSILCIAAILWIVIYILSLYFFVKTQIQPWYRWWISTKKLKLVVN